MSESLRMFRTTMPDIISMKVGESQFVPTFDPREDYVISTALKRANARHSDRRWFGLLEWRSHIRGRLIACVSLEVEGEWREVWRQMTRATQVNKKSPPLDAEGNALVPRLPLK